MSKKCLAILLSAVMLATSGAAWPSTVQAEGNYAEEIVVADEQEDSEVPEVQQDDIAVTEANVEEELSEPEVEKDIAEQAEEVAAAANDTAENAVKINVNSSYQDNCVSKSDANWYQFTTSGKGYASLSFGRKYDKDSSRRWYVTLYDGTQKKVMSRTFYCGTETTETTCKVGVPSGTYYVKVEPEYYHWSDVPYSLRVNYTTSSVWETEFNDTVDTANSVAAGTTYYGSSRENKDVDYYKINIVQAGYVSLSFGKEYDKDSSRRWYVTLYDGTQKKVMSRTFYCGTETTETTCKVGVPSGTYYVKVEPEYYHWSDVPYSLRVNYTTSSVWETEFNDTVDTANSVAAGTTYYGSSRENKDVDYYKINIVQAGYVSLSFGKEYDKDSSRRWYVTLYDGTQKKLMSRTFYCGTEATETTCKVGVPSGTYYVKVEPEYYHWSDVPYSLKVNYTSSNMWETEFNDTVDTANSMAAGTTYYGSSRERDDVDYYKVNIAQGGYVSLSFGHEYESDTSRKWNVILYDETQKELTKKTFSCRETNADTTDKIWLSAGTYYIKVQPDYYYGTDVTYSLNVRTTISTPTFSSPANTASGIYLKWSRVSSATEYDIYRRSTGSWTKIKTISSGSQTNYTDTTVKNKNGTTYYYFIVASNDQAISDASTTKKIVRVTNPTMSTAKNVTGRKIYAKWTKNTKASGYQVQYSRSKSFSSGNRTYTRTGNSAVSTTMSGLSKGRTYYVRVRAYRTVGGIKYYSAWSSAKSVKVTR